MEDNLSAAALALLRRPPGRMVGRKLQYRLDGGAAGYVNQLVAGKTALLDQIHHGQKNLPAPGQIPGQFLLVHFSLLAYGVVAFLHGGSPFKVWQPDSFRIRMNRRSTFNYGWDILAKQAPQIPKTPFATAIYSRRWAMDLGPAGCHFIRYYTRRI